MEAIVLGGSRGIGAAIARALGESGYGVLAASSSDVDTADPASVRAFCSAHPSTDVLVVNTGGPPAKEFADVTEQDWDRYHRQLFLGPAALLGGIRVNRGGHAFLISSSVVKEPSPRLVISAAYRAALSEVFKVLSREYARDGVACINIAPGLIDTDRMREVIKDSEEARKAIPMGRFGEPREIGEFVAAVASKKIGFLSGTVNFDGASGASAF